MKRRWLTLLCALLLMFVSTAQAEIQWPALTTEGQQRVHDYVQQINANLSALGSYPINSVFECYPALFRWALPDRTTQKFPRVWS